MVGTPHQMVGTTHLMGGTTISQMVGRFLARADSERMLQRIASTREPRDRRRGKAELVVGTPHRASGPESGPSLGDRRVSGELVVGTPHSITHGGVVGWRDGCYPPSREASK